MPTTPILGITQVSTSQNGKETTINDAILALENASNAKLAVSLAAGNVTLSVPESTRNYIFTAAGALAASELIFPTSVNGNPYNRVIVVRNVSDHGLTVRFASGGGSSVTIPDGESRLISASEGMDMTVAAEPPSVITFLSLTDAPDTFTGQTGRFLSVNVAEDALEFVDAAVFPTLTDNANRFLRVNSGATGVEWAVVDFAGAFTELTDTPSSFAGQGGKLVRVNNLATGLEFVEATDAEAVNFQQASRWRILLLEPGDWPANPPGTLPGDPDYIQQTDQVGFGEVEFLDQDGIDLAVGGTAYASNFLTGNEPSRAFNNNTDPADGWLTEDTYTGNVWLEYDFGSAVTPRRVRLTSINTFPQYGTTRFLIQYWDGSAWISLGDRSPAPWETGVAQSFKINGIPLDFLEEAPSNGSLYGRINGEWLKINAEVVSVNTTSYNLASTDTFQYRRFTNAGTKTLNIRTNTDHSMPSDGEWYIYNAVGAALNITPAVGVTVNAPAGGSLTVPLNGTIRIKRVAVDVYDVFGDTVSSEAGGAGDIPSIIGNASKILAVKTDATGIEWITQPIPYTDEQARDTIAAALVAGTNVTITNNDVANTITISAASIGLNAEEVRDTIGTALRGSGNIAVSVNDVANTITISTSALDAEGVRDTIGAALVAGSNMAISVNDSANTISLAATMNVEVIQDIVATTLVAGSNVLITYDDVANTITIDSLGGGGGGGLDSEQVRDVIGAALVAGSNITINVNDAADTITIDAATDPEVVRDTVASALVAGTNVTINNNDGANTITISVAMDQEVIRDTVAATLVAGTNITITPNDAANTITIASTGGGGGSTDPEVVRDTMAAALVGGTNVTITPNDLGDTITISATGGLDAEAVRDTIGAALVGGTNVTIDVNDAANTITFSAATNPETIRDTMGTALVAGSNIGISVNDGADTITISATTDQEVVRDTIAAALVAGTNVTINHDDVANTITIAAPTDTETVRDTIATALVAGSGITITVDDAANTITISTDGAASLSELSDVDTTTAPPLGGQALIFNDITDKWEPGTVSGGGGGSAYLPITTESGTTYDLPASTAGRYTRFTAVTTKTVNIRPEADEALPSDAEWHFKNVGAGNLLLSAVSGVTINAPASGSLIVPPGGVVTLKRTSADNFDLFGTTIDSSGTFPYSLPFGFVSKPLGNETLLIHVFAEDVTFSGNFSLSRGSIGTNPTATTDMLVKKNGTNVGAVSVSTAGIVSFFTTGGTPVSFVVGDVLTVVAQDPADETIANSAFTLRGARN
jgi:hypothetical protein